LEKTGTGVSEVMGTHFGDVWQPHAAHLEGCHIALRWSMPLLFMSIISLG